MKKSVLNQDFLAGMLVMGFAAGLLWFTKDLPIGSGTRMGPGYFPRGIGLALGAIGIVLAVRGIVAMGKAEPFRMPFLRPIAICVVIGVFALGIESLGLAASTFGLVFASSFCAPDATFRGAMGGATIVTGLVIFVFSWGLKLPINILPAFIG